ncbi:MAG: DUF4834 family protein [Prevotella sp.]|nr:DUF4834 family protein [Prevotella sp.]
MQFFLSLIGFLFLLFTAGMFYVVWKVRKRMKEFRDAMQDNMNDEAFQRMADKNYYRKKRNKVEFDEDYFKGNPNGSEGSQKKKQSRHSRRTYTASGVTIIDDRGPEADQKIFAQDEGEYVDFKEE